MVEEKPYIPASVRHGGFQSERLDKKSLESLDAFFAKYIKYRSDVTNGMIGKTAQFWAMYLDIMRYQTMAYTAVQENGLKLLMFCWQQFLPLYFVLNKLHYARYEFFPVIAF